MPDREKFDDLPTLSIAGEGYVQLHVPCIVAIDGGQPISVTRILVLRPEDCETLAEKLMKCARIARELSGEPSPARDIDPGDPRP